MEYKSALAITHRSRLTSTHQHSGTLLGSHPRLPNNDNTQRAKSCCAIILYTVFTRERQVTLLCSHLVLLLLVTPTWLKAGLWRPCRSFWRELAQRSVHAAVLRALQASRQATCATAANMLNVLMEANWKVM